MPDKRNDVRLIIGVTPDQKKYLDNLKKRDGVTISQMIRLVLSDYIQKNPSGRVPRIIKEEKISEENLLQADTIQKITEEMSPPDISQICDFAECSNKDIRHFNQIIETTAKDGERIVELELRSLCPTHYNYFTSEQGWKLELLE